MNVGRHSDIEAPHFVQMSPDNEITVRISPDNGPIVQMSPENELAVHMSPDNGPTVRTSPVNRG